MIRDFSEMSGEQLAAFNLALYEVSIRANEKAARQRERDLRRRRRFISQPAASGGE